MCVGRRVSGSFYLYKTVSPVSSSAAKQSQSAHGSGYEHASARVPNLFANYLCSFWAPLYRKVYARRGLLWLSLVSSAAAIRGGRAWAVLRLDRLPQLA